MIRQAYFLVFLMVITPWASADTATWQGPNSSPDDAGLMESNSTYDGFTIPTNSTITDSHFTVAPEWVNSLDNGTLWSAHEIGGFASGLTNGTSYLTSNGDLTLAPISTYGEMTDFESITPQFSSWSTQGDPAWIPVNLSMVTYGPTNATSGDFAAGSNGSVEPGTLSYIRSQFWDIPQVVRNFSLSFDRWNSFDLQDKSGIEYSVNNGQTWSEIDNWSGVSQNWETDQYLLDSIAQGFNKIGFRFYVDTSSNSSSDVGLFIDSFNLSNQGEPLRAWFHGNASGQYSPNANGTLLVPVNLSGLSNPMELTYWANWDIQGGNADNLIVKVSQDNGSTWSTISPIPGVPGQATISGGASFTQQSYGWREIIHPLPPWIVGHPNAANSLLKFQVQTDFSFNYGGSGIDGWEGIMIDDIKVYSAMGTQSSQIRLLENFTDNTSQYLQYSGNSSNDWNHIDWEGHNGPWSITETFDLIQGLPDGWRVDHVRGDSKWERGAIDNTNGYGPNSTNWPSGYNGVGINLQGQYTNNVYTHLISPIYQIPTGATARLTFNHWVCTEAAWDGGTIFTSIDDGLTWQPFGQNITGFYEIVSQVNPNSPFHGMGIFDGSTVANGCGNSNANHTFSRVSGDISHLAGNDVKIRFSFFTDTYVEEDGWYIDDAGIVIDRFRSNGSWTSPLISADDYGWARLTALYESPEGTNLTVDVLDSSGNVVEGHNNLTLPFNLKIAAWEYPELRFRLHFATSNETLTPRVSILHHGITEYLNKQILLDMDSNLPSWVYESNQSGHSNSEYTFTVALPHWKTYKEVSLDCSGNISAQLLSIPGRVPVLTNNHHGVGIGISQVIDEAECGEIMSNTFGPSQDVIIQIKIEYGEVFEWLKIEPNTLLSPLNPAIDFGDDGNIDWFWNGEFHSTNQIHAIKVDGVSQNVTNGYGFNLTYSQELEISVLLPSRKLSNQTWSCGLLEKCYRGGMNYATNGSQTPSYSEYDMDVIIDGISHSMTEYKIHFSSNKSSFFHLYSLNYISGFEHSISINSSLSTLFVDMQDKTSSLPVTISADRGGIYFDGNIEHEKTIDDVWISLPTETFVPGMTQIAISKHEALENTPPLESVKLVLSSSQSLSDSFAEVTIDNLDNGGRFIQNSGAGVISLDMQNSSWDGENATWSLQSQWLLDDYSRIYWLTYAINQQGLYLGPTVGSTGNAQYAASTNDLEVISFKAFSSNRPLHDISEPLFPLNVRPMSEISINGEVRYSGVNNKNPLSDDVDVIISFETDNGILSNFSTDINEEGKFNLSITVPEFAIDSGQMLRIIPNLVNISASGVDSANDATSSFQKATFILDKNNSRVVSLEVAAPGGNQPADGHVWHPGQDIPLRLHLIDDNGLPSTMELWYNRSGRGWESIDFLIPIGSKDVVIDLPLIDESTVPLVNEESGFLEIFVQGLDLAGNTLLNGGSAENPYATLYVQPRYSTIVSGDSIGLDIIDESLISGNTHEFNFTLSDENGINSIDLVSLDLSKNYDYCGIEWTPYSGDVTYDAGCYIRTPRVETIQRWQVNTWDVKIQFELRWDLIDDINENTNVPSLNFWDENAPLEGFSSIDLFTWKLHTGIDLEVSDAVDRIAPLGEFVDGILYIHAQDAVDIEVCAYHRGLDIPAHNLPFSASYVIELIGDKDSTLLVSNFNSDGKSSNRFVIDSAFYGTQIKVLANLNQVSTHSVSGDEMDILVDQSPPTLSLAAGSLVSVDSDSLESVPVEITLIDDGGFTSSPLIVNWKFENSGRIVEGSQGAGTIPIEFQSINSNLYSGNINLSTVQPKKGDSILIWFTATDAAGREAIGIGTNEAEPFVTVVRWIAYEPTVVDIVTEPYRPMLGDIINIQIKITNIGALDGSTNLTLFDADDRMVDEINLTIQSEASVVVNIEVEAWKIGNLGLYIQLDNDEKIPIPLSSVQDRSSDSSSSQTAVLSLAILSVFISTLVLITAYIRRNQNYDFDEEE